MEFTIYHVVHLWNRSLWSNEYKSGIVTMFSFFLTGLRDNGGAGRRLGYGAALLLADVGQRRRPGQQRRQQRQRAGRRQEFAQPLQRPHSVPGSCGTTFGFHGPHKFQTPTARHWRPAERSRKEVDLGFMEKYWNGMH